ncbi:hypothetical protein [Micromonospora sp. NBRC 101691]|uniref:hypothetical protein n=1 Tax=Micromonospora sp. NBRC 101691 TaxID=3032198 RepID=UPI00249FC17A|nr:hypothetical protein [Micromonospora sp. NBRC 101691]GLY23706.1 hypothetical protein Misp04_34380 [Micromonospora sp. NBRC 101691]
MPAGSIAAMRDADTPPQEPADHHPHLDPRTVRQRVTAIRTAVDEVYARVREWRGQPGWRNTPVNVHRYETTLNVAYTVEAMPEPDSAVAVAQLVEAVRPLLTEWRPSRPGPEQQIFAAVERLRWAIAG